MTLTELTLPPTEGSAAAIAWWGRETFFSREGGGDRCPEVIDVTGRPRFLVYGPYVGLGVGVWRATAFFHLCPDAARRSLAVQFGAEPTYTTLELPRGLHGLHRIEIIHRMTEPGLAQVRLWLKKAAFHGEVRFAGVSIDQAVGLEGFAVE